MASSRWKRLKRICNNGWRDGRARSVSESRHSGGGDREIFGSSDTDADPVAVVRACIRTLSVNSARGRILAILPAYVGLVPGYSWRAAVAALFKENAHKAGADINVLEHALKLVRISVNFSPKSSQIHHALRTARGVLLLNQ